MASAVSGVCVLFVWVGVVWMLLMTVCGCGVMAGHPLTLVPPEDMPAVRSYHVHVLFMPNNNESVAEALAMRAAFEHKFKPQGTCEGLFDQPALCMYDTDFQAAGPFTTAQWAAYVPLEDLGRVVPWCMQNREPDPQVRQSTLSLFIHPNTDGKHGIYDHGHWALWEGAVWPLDTSIFIKE